MKFGIDRIAKFSCRLEKHFVAARINIATGRRPPAFCRTIDKRPFSTTHSIDATGGVDRWDRRFTAGELCPSAEFLLGLQRHR
jgi:hypothetical protein